MNRARRATKGTTASSVRHNHHDNGQRDVDAFVLQQVFYCARTIWNQNQHSRSNSCTQSEIQKFISFFGCSPICASAVWSLFVHHNLVPRNGTIAKFLWALLFMKVYSPAETLCNIASVKSPKTFSHYVWAFIDAMAMLECELIKWEDRKKNDIGNDCLISVDGTDFHIPEMGRRYYSHKFKKSGFRYEVGLCIRTGDIVWINGPFECGIWPDINIFRDSLVSNLEPYERVEADDGYIGEAPRYVKCPKCFTNPKTTERMQARVRSRQETINKRFKQWAILKQVFRHDLQKHEQVFRAIVVLTQVTQNCGDRVFATGYRDPPY